MWESEPLPACSMPLVGDETHDGGGELGPLYVVDPPADIDGVPRPIMCGACAARHGATIQFELPWPPRETL